MRNVLGKLTYANVMATVAMFIALGGLGYAATQLPRNSVGPKQLKKGAVTPKKLSADSKKTLRGAQGPKGEKGEKGDRGAPGPSTVYAGSSAADFIGLASPPSPVLSIPVPAGSYAIQAKLNSFSQGGADIVRCRLNAGDDFDSEDATIGDEAGATESASIAMQVVHTFSAAGTVSITCLGEGGGTGVAIKNIKITAIQVGGIAANTSS